MPFDRNTTALHVVENIDLSGRVALVTGGGAGIGLSTATALASAGAKVTIADINLAASEQAAAVIRQTHPGAVVDVLHLDLGSLAQVRAFADTFRSREQKLDILVNNAGIAHIGSVLTTNESDMDRLYRINIKGVYNCSQAAIERMVPHGGGIVLNMCSIAAQMGLADRFAYSMTKGAVLMMTYSMAKDFIKQGIRCNCICPARVHTPFVDGYLANTYPGREAEMFQKLSEAQPIGRMAMPDEIAHLALYLCSDEAAFVTGTDYPIDGGFVKLNN